MKKKSAEEGELEMKAQEIVVCVCYFSIIMERKGINEWDIRNITRKI